MKVLKKDFNLIATARDRSGGSKSVKMRQIELLENYYNCLVEALEAGKSIDIEKYAEQYIDFHDNQISNIITHIEHGIKYLIYTYFATFSSDV